MVLPKVLSTVTFVVFAKSTFFLGVLVLAPRSEGLEKVKDTPSLIVLDLEMPRMDGFEFLDAYMKNYDELNRAPILVYSGKDLSEVQKDILNKNVAGMVRKDEVSMDELSKIVKNIYQESVS